MSKIDPKAPERISPGSVEARIPDRTLAAAGIDGNTNIPAPLDTYGREQLLTMMSIVREPPRMNVNGAADGALNMAAEKAVISDIETLGAAPTFDVAYKIGSLLVRRQQDVAANGDEGAMRGLRDLGEQLRMYEHLHLMQTKPT